MLVGIYRFLQQHPLHPYLASLIFSPFPLPVPVIFYPSLTRRNRHASLPLQLQSWCVKVCVCVSVCPTQRGVQWIADKTCSALLWHLSASHLSPVCRDGNEQEWHNMPEVMWRLTSLHHFLNLLHSSLLVCRLGNNNYLLPSLHTKLICKAVMSRHLNVLFELRRCRHGVGMVEDVQRVSLVCLKNFCTGLKKRKRTKLPL